MGQTLIQPLYAYWRILNAGNLGGPDEDRQVSVNRLCIGTLLSLYTMCLIYRGVVVPREAAALIVTFYVGAIALYLDAKNRPAPVPFRRVLGMGFDTAAISLLFVILRGRATLGFWAYLWLILGNGLRFGVGYLWIGTALSATGFLAATTVTGYLSSQLGLMLGLLGCLVVVPAYVGKLLRRLQEKFQNAAEEAGTKIDVLNKVSHELRPRVQAILSLHNFLGETELTLPQREMLDAADVAGRSLCDLADDLQDFSELETGQVRPSTITFSLSDLLAVETKRCMAQAQRKKLDLQVFISSNVPSSLEGDARLISLALRKIIQDAIRTPEADLVSIGVGALARRGSSVTLSFELSIVDDEAASDPASYQGDSGIGIGLANARRIVELLGGTMSIGRQAGTGSHSQFSIPVRISSPPDLEAPLSGLGVVLLTANPEDHNTIVSRFEELNLPVSVIRTPAELEHTAGLGMEQLRQLALVVDGRGGTIHTSLNVIRGTSALRDVPLVLLADTSAVPAAATRRYFVTSITSISPDGEILAALRLAGASLVSTRVIHLPSGRMVLHPERSAPLRILVVEDSNLSRRILERTLKKAGFLCTFAGDGDQALDLFSADVFDVVLMDINIPGINGIETAQMLQYMALGGDRELLIIGVTGDATEEVAQKCREAGMAICLTKPIDPRHLIEVIEDQVRRAASSRPARRRAEVAILSTHPRFQPSHSSDLDLGALSKLAGPDEKSELFRNIVEAFDADTSRIRRGLRQAVDQKDQAQFLAQLRALQSVAAEVGAVRLAATAQRAQLISIESQREAVILLESLDRDIERIMRDLMPGGDCM